LGKWVKGESGNSAGRPPNKLRDKTLQEILEIGAQHLSITGPGGEKVSSAEARIEGLYRRAIDGEIQAIRIICKLLERFLPKSQPKPIPNDVRIVEFPLTQDTVDSWHQQGYFPDGTPLQISDISEFAFNEAYRRSQERINDDKCSEEESPFDKSDDN